MYRIKLSILLLSGLLLTSCGFKPVYAQNQPSAIAELNQIYVEAIPGRSGQVLRNKLLDLLNPKNQYADDRYILKITLEEERRQFGIQEDLRITRYDITALADYVLIDTYSNKEVLKDSAKIYSSFNRTDSEFSTFVAEEDAREKASEQLAFEIRGKLAALFSK